MARQACVPVYDTVTQAFRASYCRDFQAGRTLWTSPHQVSGPAFQPVFLPQQQRSDKGLLQGHTGRNTEKLEISPTRHHRPGRSARLQMPQPSHSRLINSPIARPGQSDQEFIFPLPSAKTNSETNNKSQMRKDKQLSALHLLNQTVVACTAEAPKQDATKTADRWSHPRTIPRPITRLS